MLEVAKYHFLTNLRLGISVTIQNTFTVGSAALDFITARQYYHQVFFLEYYQDFNLSMFVGLVG